MANPATLGAISTLGLLAAYCSPRLGMLEVPSTVQAGTEFTITVHGNDAVALNGGRVGCVVQLPNSVAVNGYTVFAQGYGPSIQVTRDRAALLGMYAAEPGHWLASFDGSVTQTHATLTLFLQAPVTAPGPLTVKVALVGDMPTLWTPSDPSGTTNFAAIGGANARSFTLVPDPPRFDRVPGLPLLPIQRAAFGDVDGDGNDDLIGVEVTAAGGTLHACLLRPGSPWQVVMTPTNPMPPAPVLALGRFDADPHLDVVIPGQVLYGDGLGGFTAVPLPNVGVATNWIAAGDVDGDGLDDIALVDQQTIASVLRSNGNRTFAAWSNGLPSQPVQNQFFASALLHDLTGDGLADLVVTRQYSPAVDVYVGDGTGNWTNTTVTASAEVSTVGAGDLNGDGRDDLVVGLRSGTSILEAFTRLPGSWSPLTLSPIAGLWAESLALLDYDRDGRLDIAVADMPGYSSNARWDRLRLLRNAGAGSLVEVSAGLSAFGQQGPWLATGDVDGDTFPDLAVMLPVVWRNTGSGLSPYGAGCAAAGHAPWLGANGQPVLGNAGFALQLHDGVPGGGALCWLGFSKRYAFGLPQLPFELTAFGAPGCKVLAEQVALRFLLHDAQGVATMPLPLPNDPSLHRLLLFAQGAALVPGANALGALFSGGLAVRVP